MTHCGRYLRHCIELLVWAVSISSQALNTGKNLEEMQIYWWKWSRSVVSDSLQPVDCSPPSSSVHRILQARILEWVAISLSRGSSRPRDRTQVAHIAGRRFNLCTTREACIFWAAYWFSCWSCSPSYLFQINIKYVENEKEHRLTSIAENCSFWNLCFWLSLFPWNAGIIQMLRSDESISKKEIAMTLVLTGTIPTCGNNWEENQNIEIHK